MQNNTIYSIGDKDYIYSKDFTRIDNPEKSYENVRKAYYQSEIHKLSCSLHAAMTVVSNNHGYMFSKQERMEILGMAIDRGFDPSFGWYTDKAVKCVVDYCNEELKLDLMYIRVTHNEYEDLANRGFGVVTGYRQKLGMGKDRAEDGVLGDDVGTYTGFQYGHLVSFWCFEKRENQREEYNGKTKGKRKFGFVDNYFPKHANNETHVVNLNELVSTGVVFPNGYIIVKRKNAKAKTVFALQQKVRDLRKFFTK